MNIRFRCPKCRQKYSVDRSNVGKQTTCQKCGEKLAVPTVVTSATSRGAVHSPAEPPVNVLRGADPYLLAGVIGGAGFFLLSLVLLFVFSGEKPPAVAQSAEASSHDAASNEARVPDVPTEESAGELPYPAPAAESSEPSPLELALIRGTSSQGQLITEIHELGPYNVETEAQAAAICDALARLPLDQPEGEGVLAFTTPLREIALMFQRVSTPQAMHYLSDRGLPKLQKIFDAEIESEEPRPELLDLLQVFAMYETEAGAERLIRAARRPLLPDHPSWTHILRTIDKEHLQRDLLMKELGQPIPQGNIANDVLVVANRLASSGDLTTHPFNNEQGAQRLGSWLTINDNDVARDDSAAFQAVITIPYLDPRWQKELLDLALSYPNQRVQLEAAWSAAKVDDPRGLTLLQEAAQDVETSVDAVNYLKALGKLDTVSGEVLNKDFQAKALMTSWLSQPSQFGRPPDKLTVLDSRNLVWPPLRERIDVWLLRFEYEPPAEGDSPVVQVGMVGSVTSSLPKLTSASMSPEEIYAMHCCWELQQARDARAPDEISVEAGLEILGVLNSDFATPPITD